MNVNNLIEQLKECSTYGFKQEICGEAATALSVLQAENARLKESVQDARLEGYAKGIDR